MGDDFKPDLTNSWGGKRPRAGRKPGVPNKLTRDVKALASQHGPEALQTLVRIMCDGESEQARIAAAKELLDRGYGRPRQEIDVNRDRSVTVVVQRTPPVVEVPAIVDHSPHGVNER